MNDGQRVFSQIMAFLPIKSFRRIAIGVFVPISRSY